MARFTTWLRVNSQHYLLQDAHVSMARKYGYPVPPVRGSFFWTKVFVPVYRLMPWGLRQPIMTAIPGSHRKPWSTQMLPEGPAI
ncbi:MAG: hypothetical protein ACO3JT_01795 [Candidatus Nanopelagicales bacterium]|jgi:hypothetical protein